jgi:hypothetical protein
MNNHNLADSTADMAPRTHRLCLAPYHPRQMAKLAAELNLGAVYTGPMMSISATKLSAS